MRDLILLGLHEWSNIVFLAVHLEDDEDILGGNQELLSIVLCNSCLNKVLVGQWILACDDDFLVVCLVVVSVSSALHWETLFEKVGQIDLGTLLFEGQANQLVVSVGQQVHGINISHLNESKLSKDLGVDDSEVVVYGLVEDHVVDKTINLLTNGPYLFNIILLNKLKKLSYLINHWHFVNDALKELNEISVVVVDTEEQAVKDGHRVLFHVC